MLKFLLINSPLFENGIRDGGEDYLPPLGLGYIATNLKQKKIDIKECRQCGLFKNQRPIVDKISKAEVMWVGLSAKEAFGPNFRPLDSGTNTGKVLDLIENSLSKVNFFRTNLVKCLPLDNCKKIRYPSNIEKDRCYENLLREIVETKPKVIFLLGNEVIKFIFLKNKLDFKGLDKNFNYKSYKINGIFYVPAHHPSSIYIYKRKKIDFYIDSIKGIIKDCLSL